jgi:hypothetical protein
MGDLLSLHPKIHCLYADAQINGRLADCEGQFLAKERRASL